MKKIGRIICVIVAMAAFIFACFPIATLAESQETELYNAISTECSFPVYAHAEIHRFSFSVGRTANISILHAPIYTQVDYPFIYCIILTDGDIALKCTWGILAENLLYIELRQDDFSRLSRRDGLYLIVFYMGEMQ